MTSSEGALDRDLDAYRRELRAFLATPALDPWRDTYHPEVVADLQHGAGLLRLLYDAGFGRYGYPLEIGGLGGDIRHCAVLYDELTSADIPLPPQYELITTLASPTIRYAPKLAVSYLAEFVRGDVRWGQGFSEPDAGSDLASLRCRAVRDGDEYVISGQKLWTSYAATATRIMLLARTGTPESRHRGLSMLLLDVGPGVTIRPVYLANGRAELAECFFDDMRVPADRLIGEEGQGWEVAMYLLQFERAVYGWLRCCQLLRRLRKLAALAEPSAESHRLLGGVYLDLLSLRARSVTTVRRLAAGEAVGPEASADKLLLSASEHSVYDAARTLLGESFVLADDERLSEWRDLWWFSRTTSIFGGASEVQRGIIADRVLRLPKE